MESVMHTITSQWLQFISVNHLSYLPPMLQQNYLLNALIQVINSYEHAFWSFPHQIKSPTHILFLLCTIIQITFKIKRVFSMQTALLEPMELSAARRATAKVAYVTGRQALAWHLSFLPELPASSGVSHKQVRAQFLFK